MKTTLTYISILFLLAQGCGSDKHLPSSNPPEYDPKKVYTPPSPPPSVGSAPITSSQPTEFEWLKSQLESLEAGQTAKGEGKRIPFDQNLLPQFKGVTNPCEALSRLAPGLSSTQLFTGTEGAALKKALGTDADGIARRMDEQVAEGLKQSLGAGAADCPISVRPHKSSGFIDRSPSPRLVLTHTTLNQPLLLAQTTIPHASQDDYDVPPHKPQRENAPPEWVGWKMTDTMTRTGKEDRPTKGIREDYEMVIAPKTKQCPRLGPELEGIVDGKFEWSFMMFRATPGPQSVLYRRHVKADLKGEVDDDAKLKKVVKFDATVTIQHIGTELPPYSRTFPVQGEFSIDQQTGIPEDFKVITVSGFSEGEAQAKDAQLIGTLTPLIGVFSGPEYRNAQTIWNNPNTCVEITFTPPTKTKKFVPSESTPVKTELRTKNDQRHVPAKFKEAKERPREGNGRVSPREDKSEISRPATFTYQAPATKIQHSGFRLSAVSRAGVAEEKDGEWELAEGSYVLEFQSRIVSTEPTEPVESVAAGKVVLTSVEGKEGWYRGSGMLGYQTGPPPNRDPCSNLVMGHGTTRFDVAGMSIKLSERTGATGRQVGSADIELHYLIHPTNETVRHWAMVDFQCVPGKEFPIPFFHPMYAVARGAEEVNLLKGWTYVGRDGVVAKKVLRGNCGDYCQDETVFMLKEADDRASPPK